jgi:hypothetical protein
MAPDGNAFFIVTFYFSDMIFFATARLCFATERLFVATATKMISCNEKATFCYVFVVFSIVFTRCFCLLRQGNLLLCFCVVLYVFCKFVIVDFSSVSFSF